MTRHYIRRPRRRDNTRLLLQRQCQGQSNQLAVLISQATDGRQVLLLTAASCSFSLSLLVASPLPWSRRLTVQLDRYCRTRKGEESSSMSIHHHRSLCSRPFHSEYRVTCALHLPPGSICMRISRLLLIACLRHSDPSPRSSSSLSIWHARHAVMAITVLRHFDPSSS
jgi:hypothetical protein